MLFFGGGILVVIFLFKIIAGNSSASTTSLSGLETVDQIQESALAEKAFEEKVSTDLTVMGNAQTVAQAEQNKNILDMFTKFSQTQEAALNAMQSGFQSSNNAQDSALTNLAGLINQMGRTPVYVYEQPSDPVVAGTPATSTPTAPVTPTTPITTQPTTPGPYVNAGGQVVGYTPEMKAWVTEQALSGAIMPTIADVAAKFGLATPAGALSVVPGSSTAVYPGTSVPVTTPSTPTPQSNIYIGPNTGVAWNTGPNDAINPSTQQSWDNGSRRVVPIPAK